MARGQPSPLLDSFVLWKHSDLVQSVRLQKVLQVLAGLLLESL
jgi:hypothetical protein